MNAILGYAQLLEARVIDADELKFVDIIQKSGYALLTIIDDILDYSKAEAGQLQIQLVPTKVRRILADLKDVFNFRAAQANIQFVLNIDPELPESLYLDEVRLRQVLMNLVGNAFKFTETGVIEISAQVRISPNELEKIDLEIAVKDSGIGIPEEQQALIFEPFRQKDGQSSRKYGGTGLGLAIVRKLVSMMGGTVALTSKVGDGSTFTLTIPDVVIADRVPLTSGEIEQWQDGQSADHFARQDFAISDRLIEKMQEIYNGLWQICMLNNRMSDIKELASLIKQLAKTYTCQPLDLYADHLDEAARSYNSKKIRELLGEFPGLIDNLTKHREKGS